MLNCSELAVTSYTDPWATVAVMAPTFSIRPQNSSTKRSWSPGTPNSKPTTPVLEFSKETGGQVDISVPEFLRQSNTGMSLEGRVYATPHMQNTCRIADLP